MKREKTSELLAILANSVTLHDMEKSRIVTEMIRRKEASRALAHSLGARYESCRLTNYACPTKAQLDATQALEAACESYADPYTSRGIVLYGRPGTGKDHLLSACLQRVAEDWGVTCRWLNGLELYAEVRERIAANETEAALVREYARPDVLAISDPVPPFGAVTDFQATTLLRILDRRYREVRPTWVSLNVANGDEANKRLGAAITDRLRDNAVTIYTDWPSFRKAAT